MIFNRAHITLSLFASLVVFTMLITACASNAEVDENGADVLIAEAQIKSLDLLILESFPVQVKALVRWNLSDDCTVIFETSNERVENLFQVKILTKRPADKECTQVVSSFEETFTLDVYGLDPGTYTVDVNGVVGEFTLDVKNEVQQ